MRGAKPKPPRNRLAVQVRARHWTREDFRAEFAAAAKAAGKPRFEIGPSTAQRWLDGRTILPRPAASLILERMFGCTVEELFAPTDNNTSAAAPAAVVRHEPEPAQPPHQQATAGLEQLWHGAELTGVLKEVTATLTGTVDRRRFIAVSSASILAAHAWLIAEPARLSAALSGKTADASVITDLTTSVDTLRRLDDKLGGQAVYGMVVEQLRLTTGLLRNASYSQANGRDLYAIAAELSRLAGWTAYDAGAHGTAQRYYLIGLRAAHEADHPGIAANILRCMAQQSRSTGDPRTAVDLLRSAQKGADGRLTHTEEAVINAHLARSYGRLGDRQSALYATEAAYSEFEQAQPADDPPYVYWVGYQEIAYAAGDARLYLGDSAAAIPYFESSIDSAPGDLPRDLLEQKARLALAHAMSGDLDSAVSLAHDTISERTLSSAIVGTHFTDVVRAVTNARYPGAKELTEHLQATTSTEVA